MQQSTYTPSQQPQPSVMRGGYSTSNQQQGSLYQGSSVQTGSRLITGGAAGPERIQSTRKISSTIVNEQMMGPPPQDLPVREVEVPGPIQEVITHVPRKEIIETEKRVPKYEYEYVDKIVEVPRIEYVDRTVEVPRYQEVIVEKKIPQIVDVPREVVREVKIPRVNYVEKVVEVPGETIEVPKPYNVEQRVEFTRYTDKKRPVVVAQTVKPMIVEGGAVTEVDVYEYEPECVPVDVHVVKGVQAQVQAGGVIETVHRVVSVPSSQYNTLLQQLNGHLSQSELQKLPYMTERGQVTFLGERLVVAEPQPGVSIEGLDMLNMVSTYVDQASRNVLPVNDNRASRTSYTAYDGQNSYLTSNAQNAYMAQNTYVAQNTYAPSASRSQHAYVTSNGQNAYVTSNGQNAYVTSSGPVMSTQPSSPYPQQYVAASSH